MLSHPSCCFGCVWCSSPPQGSSVISRKRDLSPYAPATRRAWSPAARYGTGAKLCCVDVGAAPSVAPLRHGTVVTVVVLGTAVVSRAAVAAGVIVVDHSSNVAPVASRNCRHRRRSRNGSCVTRRRRRRCSCGPSLCYCGPSLVVSFKS